jgi:CheY-like chemotaxis protein
VSVETRWWRIFRDVEDDEFDRMTLTRMLEKCGYGVMAAKRVKNALDAFTINHPQLALVLASARLSNAERIRFAHALSRIDERVPHEACFQLATGRPRAE